MGVVPVQFLLDDDSIARPKGDIYEGVDKESGSMKGNKLKWTKTRY